MGSVYQVVDANGNLVNSYHYNAWGEVRASETTETVANPFLWQTKPWDEEIGMYYSRARYYEAGSGRFVAVDPIVLLFQSIGEEKYAGYALNPVDLTDASGLIWDFPGSLDLGRWGWEGFKTGKLGQSMTALKAGACTACFAGIAGIEVIGALVTPESFEEFVCNEFNNNPLLKGACDMCASPVSWLRKMWPRARWAEMTDILDWAQQLGDLDCCDQQ